MSAFKNRHIVEVRNVISRSEYIALMGQQSGVAEEGHTIDALLRAGVPKCIARIALDNAGGVDHSVVAWTRGDDADIASAMAVRSALRLCNQEGLSSASFGYVSCRALVEQWRGADLYGASSRERSIAPLRSKRVLVVAGVDGVYGADEAESLVALLESRRLDMLPTLFSSSQDGRGLAAALRQSRASEGAIGSVLTCIAGCVRLLDAHSMDGARATCHRDRH